MELQWAGQNIPAVVQLIFYCHGDFLETLQLAGNPHSPLHTLSQSAILRQMFL